MHWWPYGLVNGKWQVEAYRFGERCASDDAANA